MFTGFHKLKLWVLAKITFFVDLKTLDHFKDKKVMKKLKFIMKEDKPFLFQPIELFMIYSLASAQNVIEGDYAEVGVFKGASAKTICEVKGDKNFYLFDTFEGLPEVSNLDLKYSKKMFFGEYNYVKNKLSNYNHVYIYKGLFPQSATPIKNRKFAFVHLDVDLYQSTLNCLDFFYKRMQKGGIILTHDYARAEGVKKAFDEFLLDKPEKLIELSMTQGMIIKK